MLKRQMLALVASRLTLGFNTGERAVTLVYPPIEQIEAWQVKGDQPLDWPQTITLCESYFKELTEHAVPLDWRALKALRGSAPRHGWGVRCSPSGSTVLQGSLVY